MRFKSFFPLVITLVIAGSMFVAGCSDDDDDNPAGPSNTDIIGNWDMTHYIVTDSTGSTFEIRSGNMFWYDWRFIFYTGDSGRYVIDGDTDRCEWHLTGAQLRIIDRSDNPEGEVTATVSGTTFTFNEESDEGDEIDYYFAKQ